MQRPSRLAVRRIVPAAFVAALGSLALLVMVLIAGAGSGGCQTATQVTVELRTFGALPCGSLEGVAIVVAGSPHDAEDRMKLGSFSAQVSRGACNADGHTIGTLVITPGDATGSIIVRARVSDAPDATCVPPDYKGCIVARRSFSFIDHAAVTLPITLEAACLDVPCDQESSCRSGVCVSSKTGCSESGSCTSSAEPVPLGDGAAAPPPPDDVVVPDAGVADASMPDTSPGIDSSFDAPIDVTVDSPPLMDVYTDVKSDGPGAKGLCPTNGGNFDCVNTGSTPICCLQPSGFVCASSGACPAPYPHYNCTSPLHCGGDPCCGGVATAGDGAPGGFVASCTGVALCSSQGKETLCATNADCPAGTPSCTKIVHQYNGHFTYGCE